MTYVSGFVTAVPTANKDAYVETARKAAVMFKEFGALSVMEAWGDNVPDGKVTDFRRAVQATADETVVFSWVVWPDRATSDEAERKMVEGDRMQEMGEMPFDGKRMIYGGFTPIFEA